MITEQQLAMIEECGKCQFDYEQTATIAAIDKDVFIKEVTDASTQCYLFYTRGKLKAEFEVRKSIYTLAIQGSSQAQLLYQELVKKHKMSQA